MRSVLLQVEDGDLLTLVLSLFCVTIVYCISILCLHIWYLMCLTFQQRVFFNCNVLLMISTSAGVRSTANTFLVFNLDANSPIITHFKLVFLCLFQ